MRPNSPPPDELTQTLSQGATSGEAEVLYDTAGDQRFTVVIPKKIVLGSNKQAEYEITVKGEVAQGSKVKVEPRDDAKDVDGINFEMSIASGKTGGTINAVVTQADTEWNYNDIINETTKPGNINAHGLTIGKWSGDLTFLINFDDEYGDGNTGSGNENTDPADEEIGSKEELDSWLYELNEEDKTITLLHYLGREFDPDNHYLPEDYGMIDVTVYSTYHIDDDVYKTCLATVYERDEEWYERTGEERFIEQYGGLFDSYYEVGDYHGSYEVRSITFNNGIDTSNLKNMAGMFQGCGNLKSINFGDIDTSNVTDMNHMFSSCNKLTNVDISSFDTSNVTDMDSMFYYCFAIENIDFGDIDTSKVTNMSSMFWGDEELRQLDVSGFDTSNVTDMYGMFRDCNKLTSIDVSGFDTSNVTDMRNMFDMCFNLTDLDVSGFNTGNVKNMSTMFKSCESITDLDLSNFDTSKVTNMYQMFQSCESITDLDLSNFDTSKVTTMYQMFDGCKSLESLNISNFNTSRVTRFEKMFYNCELLESLDLSNFDTNKAKNMSNMFQNCSNMGVIYADQDKWSTSQATTTDMFTNCGVSEVTYK